MQRRIFTLLCIWMLSNSVLAAGIGILPTKILLWPEQISDIVKLINQADEPINLQVSSKSWDMDENGYLSIIMVS